jgi:hypothetical protein
MNGEFKDELRKKFPDVLGGRDFEIVQTDKAPPSGEWLGWWRDRALWIKRTIFGEKVGLAVFVLTCFGLYDYRDRLAMPMTYLAENVSEYAFNAGPAPAFLDLWHTLPARPFDARSEPMVAVTIGCAVNGNGSSNTVMLSAGTAILSNGTSGGGPTGPTGPIALS